MTAEEMLAEFWRARERMAAIPPYYQPVVTRPILRKRGANTANK